MFIFQYLVPLLFEFSGSSLETKAVFFLIFKLAPPTSFTLVFPNLSRTPLSHGFYKSSLDCFRARILIILHRSNTLIILISIVILRWCSCSWFVIVGRRRRERKQTCGGSYVRVISPVYSNSTSTRSWKKLKGHRHHHHLRLQYTFPITIWLDLDCSFLDFTVGAGNSSLLFCCLVVS